jgi:hypothetical protein
LKKERFLKEMEAKGGKQLPFPIDRKWAVLHSHDIMSERVDLVYTEYNVSAVELRSKQDLWLVVMYPLMAVCGNYPVSETCR